MNCYKKTGCLLLLAAAYLLYLPQALADDTKGGYNHILVESQQKYRVPAEIADALWRYIRQSYNTGALKKINPHFSAQAATETYVDEYYDDARYTLLRHQHGLRLRRIFTGKEIDRQFIQVKISPRPRQRHLRREIKFNLNDRPDKKGGDPGHPLLRLIRGSDRPLLDSVLTGLQVSSRDLRPVLTLHQNRRRLYLRDRGNDLAVISLDAVTTEDGQTGFYELELALDEPAYTRAKAPQRQRLHHLIGLLQLDLSGRFPVLRQDQTPKYNTLYNLLHQGRIRPRLYNLAWLGVGLLVGGLCLYLFLTRNQPLPQRKEMF